MIIKKYKASSEEAAIILARDDLGKDAIVMNIKTIKPKGLFRLFKKKIVEVTAAIDDNSIIKEVKINSENNNNKTFKTSKTEYTETNQNTIEEKINGIAKLLEMQIKSAKDDMENESISNQHFEGGLSDRYTKDRNIYDTNIYDRNMSDGKSTDRNIYDRSSYDRESFERNFYERNYTDISNMNLLGNNRIDNNKKGNKIIELIHTQLIENEVLSEYADEIIKELDANIAEKSIDYVLSNVYQKIVLKLGEVNILKESFKKPKVVFFVGNTGVGKTTTMAKLVSKYLLDYNKKVAMISVDTYRIAAIEQIKTYASILNTPMEVAYTNDDIRNIIAKYSDVDYIFVDTAGRSHNNDKQTNDLKEILDTVKEYEKEVYLVVSATTKYSDLRIISKAYSDITDYKIIFTKLDETRGLGNILNIKMETKKDLSYVTWGQNVPEDLGELNPQVIAKKLLGGND